MVGKSYISHSFFVMFSSMQGASQYMVKKGGSVACSWMITFKENVLHSSLYLDAKGELKFLKSNDWLSLRINWSFSRRLTLISPRKQKVVKELSRKVFIFGGL